jgi:hypothetical protein
MKKHSDSRHLVGMVAAFCRSDAACYRHLRGASHEYSSQITADAIIIYRHDVEPFPILSFATSDGATLSLTNIVPKTTSSIGVSIYNEFAMHFVRSFRRYGRTVPISVRVSVTSDELSLDSIVPGQKTRAYLERFLALHPKSRHFFDVRRLDTFTCAVFRYSRGHLDVDRLRAYLTEKLSWSREDADWCCSRVAVGLEVLEANREY